MPEIIPVTMAIDQVKLQLQVATVEIVSEEGKLDSTSFCADV